MALVRVLGVLAVVCLLGPAPASLAQTLPGTGSDAATETLRIPDDASPELIRDLVSRLSDQQVRELLLYRLDAQAIKRNGVEESHTDFVAFVESAATGVAGSVFDAVQRLPNLVKAQSATFAAFYDKRGGAGTATFLAQLFIALTAGAVAVWAMHRVTNRWRDSLASVTGQENLRETLRFLGRRLFIDVSSLAALLIVTVSLVRMMMSESDLPFARMVVFNLVALPMAMAAMSRVLIAPYRPHLRLVHTDDDTARRLHRHQILWVLLIGFQIAILDFNARNGAALGELRLGFWLNMATLAYLGFMAYHFREGLSLMLRGPDANVTPAEAWVAKAYPYALMIACGLTWLLVEILVSQELFHLVINGQHYLTLLLLAMAPAMDTLIRGLVRHLVSEMKGEGVVAEAAYTATKRSYIRIGRAIVFGLVVIAIGQIWEIDFANLASAGFGARAAGRLLEVLAILGAGYLAYEVVTLLVNRKLADEQTALGVDMHSEEPGGGEGGGLGGSRLSTVLPLVRWALQSAIIVITVLLALGNIGIDITPLLAGAGIIGLAIGFGAQKLVADVVSGIFFLIDDAFRTGEYVDIDGTLGTVEKISIRSLQLRHHRGPVHTIPFGEIPKITNYSRDWVIMKMRFTVPFDTDLTKVKKIFKKIGADLMQVPEFADDLLQPFKSQGVLEVGDVGIVVRGKFMAKPGTQFTLRKEIYSRVQKAFEENGIEFARREVRVRLDSDEAPSLTPDQQQAIAAAAAEAAGQTAPAEAPQK